MNNKLALMLLISIDAYTFLITLMLGCTKIINAQCAIFLTVWNVTDIMKLYNLTSIELNTDICPTFNCISVYSFCSHKFFGVIDNFTGISFSTEWPVCCPIIMVDSASFRDFSFDQRYECLLTAICHWNEVGLLGLPLYHTKNPLAFCRTTTVVFPFSSK